MRDTFKIFEPEAIFFKAKQLKLNIQLVLVNIIVFIIAGIIAVLVFKCKINILGF